MTEQNMFGFIISIKNQKVFNRVLELAEIEGRPKTDMIFHLMRLGIEQLDKKYPPKLD